MIAIKKYLQEYWENLPSDERRWILSHIVTYRQLPSTHHMFKEDDIPYDCLKAWMEETVAKMDFNFDYSNESCCHG